MYIQDGDVAYKPLGDDDPPRRKKWIAVINDDASQLQSLCRLLQGDGWQTGAYTGAEEGLAGIVGSDSPPDLIITDIYMPGMDGWRFCRLLRSPEYGCCNLTPILVVSATSSEEDAGSISFDVGADAFLSFPINDERFLTVVKGLTAGESPRMRSRVLIVDDSRTVTGMLEKTFDKKGYEASVVASVAEAREYFHRYSPDIVVLDYHLPDGNGGELLVEFQAQRPSLVTIMITADPDSGLALEWMKQGAAAYAHKPFDPEYLVELAKKARRERGMIRVEVLREQRLGEIIRREEALRESEKRYRTFMDSSTDFVFLKDDRFRYVMINKAKQTLLGKSEAEVLGKTAFDLMSKDMAEMCLRSDQKAIAQNRIVIDYEKRGDKEYESRKFPVPLANGVVGVGAFIRDLTEHRRSEANLRRLAEAVTQAAEAVCITDTDGLIEYVNPAFERVSGYSCGEVAGRNPRFLKSGVQDEAFYRAVWDTITAGKIWSGRIVNRRKDGAVYTEDCTISPVRDEKGTIERFVALKRDISKEVELEEQFLQSQRLESVGQLAAGVAHDLNNLLSPILGYADLLLLELDPSGKQHAKVREIAKAGERSRDLVRQLLAFGRRQMLELKVMDLRRIIGDMESLLRRMIREDIALEIDFGKSACNVLIDQGQIEQILMNLAVNAQDAMPDGGKLMIEVAHAQLDEAYGRTHAGVVPGLYVQLTVSDTGEGIDEETRRRIFEPFFTTKGNLGTGLGLSTVYGIVKQHGGNIWVYSEEGKGTTFKVYFPTSRQEAAPQLDPVKRDDLPRGSETILVVEDDGMVRGLACDILEKQGYRVIAATNGEEAIRVLADHMAPLQLTLTDVIMPEVNGGEEVRGPADHPDPVRLMLTDVVMPGMNGKELFNKVSRAYPDLKVLFMSGYTQNVIAHHGVLEEGIPFIQKPFTVRDLAEKVREILTR